MKVGDVMTRPARSCQPTHSADTVMRTLWEQDLGALPVVNDAGEPVAMITDRDIAVAAYTQGKTLNQLVVHSAMSKLIYTAHISDSLVTAERKMRMHQVRRLPVVDESTRLVGILSLNDIALSRSASASTSPGDALDVVQTLAAIARPRRSAEAQPTQAQRAVEPRPAERATAPASAPRQTPSQVRELAGAPAKAARAGRARQR